MTEPPKRSSKRKISVKTMISEVKVSTPKKTTNEAESIIDIYKNKNFVLPKEKTFETIFEEPKSKDGKQQLTSVKKLKRFVQFSDELTRSKVIKRRKRAKCLAKNYFSVTRPLPQRLEMKLNSLLSEKEGEQCRETIDESHKLSEQHQDTEDADFPKNCQDSILKHVEKNLS